MNLEDLDLDSGDLTFRDGVVLVGDCLERLRDLPDCSVDAVVTDPPYLIGFMGKDWDSADGIAGQPEVWRECLRVLKPGGHLAAFGGTRTYHRLACAVEDAGFEIRDSLTWMYGSGFPKSLDVSKAIDKAAGAQGEWVQKKRQGGGVAKSDHIGQLNGAVSGIGWDYAPATAAAQQWQGWGTALKPAHEPIVLARKPLSGTVAATVLEWGTGGLNIDGCRVGVDGGWKCDPSGTQVGDPARGAEFSSVGSTPITAGRWPANVILGHTTGCAQTGTTDEQIAQNTGYTDVAQADGWGTRRPVTTDAPVAKPVFACAPGCPIAALDAQSGQSKAGKPRQDRGKGGIWSDGNGVPCGPQHGDSGGASRFFTNITWQPDYDVPFRYQAKPSRRERNAGLDGLPEKPWRSNKPVNVKREDGSAGRPNSNYHPTVKPVALMRWLIRLITPPGGIVLDPFLGSGTTVLAATAEGHPWIGCEKTDEYLPIITGRVQHAEQEHQQPALPIEK